VTTSTESSRRPPPVSGIVLSQETNEDDDEDHEEDTILDEDDEEVAGGGGGGGGRGNKRGRGRLVKNSDGRRKVTVATEKEQTFEDEQQITKALAVQIEADKETENGVVWKETKAAIRGDCDALNQKEEFKSFIKKMYQCGIPVPDVSYKSRT
jgi:hypothetical protein